MEATGRGSERQCRTGPASGPGGPSAVRAADGTFWLVHRLRRPHGDGRGYADVIARSADGVSFETVDVLGRDEFARDLLERPALVTLPDGTWRANVSCATPYPYHLRVDTVDAPDPSGFSAATHETVLPGDAAAMSGRVDDVVRRGPGWLAH